MDYRFEFRALWIITLLLIEIIKMFLTFPIDFEYIKD